MVQGDAIMNSISNKNTTGTTTATFFPEGDTRMEGTRPLLRIQCDWYDGIRNGEKVWISCSIPGSKPIYGYILSNGAKKADLRVQATENFEVNIINKTMIQVSCASQNVSSVFHAPFSTFPNVHSKAVRCIDVSSGGALGISSSDDETLTIWNTSDGAIRRCLEGHVSDVTHCRFFPSGMVALSGGMDMRLRIWSVEDGTCARVLTGHKGAITDTAIIEKGKNFISCSRDGTAKLWNCGRGECDSTLIDCGSVINACAIGPHESATAPDGFQPDGSELSGKMAAVARDDGILSIIDVGSKSEVFKARCSSSISCCLFMSENEILTGCQDGVLSHFDLRKISAPLSTIKIGDSTINHMARCSRFLALARGDGSVQFLDPSNPMETSQLSGPDCDAIYRICCHNDSVYSACRDGSIRKYVIR